MTAANRNIDPPEGFPPVADFTDPQLGPGEIPPCPGLDGPGSVYLVGVERETWVSVAVRGADVLGWAFVGPSGRVLHGKPLNRELLRRGARVMRLVRRWGPTVARAEIGAPLLPVVEVAPVQLGLFGASA